MVTSALSVPSVTDTGVWPTATLVTRPFAFASSTVAMLESLMLQLTCALTLLVVPLA